MVAPPKPNSIPYAGQEGPAFNARNGLIMHWKGVTSKVDGSVYWKVVIKSNNLAKGSSEARDRMAEIRKFRYQKPIKPNQAQLAFNRYYSDRNVGPTKKWKSTARMQAARTRDLCSYNPNMKRENSSYRRNPGRFDYPGLDDGSNCPHGSEHFDKIQSKKRKESDWIKRVKAVRAANDDMTYRKAMEEAKKNWIK
jgi:hypothetical protein